MNEQLEIELTEDFQTINKAILAGVGQLVDEYMPKFDTDEQGRITSNIQNLAVKQELELKINEFTQPYLRLIRDELDESELEVILGVNKEISTKDGSTTKLETAPVD